MEDIDRVDNLSTGTVDKSQKMQIKQAMEDANRVDNPGISTTNKLQKT